MAHRLLPFRQYDENNVVNLYSLNADGLNKDLRLMAPADNDINADGVIVGVSNGDFDQGVIDVSENNKFMAGYDSPVGRNPYPTNPLKVSPTAVASGAAGTLGVTLRQTLANDENGESLLFNPVKKDELQAVLSGQTVPVLTKGIVTIHEDALAAQAGAIVVGSQLSHNGKGAFCLKNNSDAGVVGKVIASGNRGDNKNANYQGINSDFQSGQYFVVQLDC